MNDKERPSLHLKVLKDNCSQIYHYYKNCDALRFIDEVSFVEENGNTRVKIVSNQKNLEEEWEWHENKNYKKPFEDNPKKIDKRKFIWSVVFEIVN